MPADEPGLDRVLRVVEVGLVEQSRRRALEDGEVELATVELLQRERGHRPVVTTGDELEVEDPDHAPIHEIDQGRKPSPVILLPGNSTIR